MTQLLVGIVVGIIVGVVFGSRIAAELKAGFQLLHNRIASLESAIKSKL